VVHLAGPSPTMCCFGHAALHVCTSRLVEGRYPRWRDVFPKRADALKLNLTVGPFHSALRQASIACTNESPRISISRWRTGTLTLAAIQHRGTKGPRSAWKCQFPYDGAKLGVRSITTALVERLLKVARPAKR